MLLHVILDCWTIRYMYKLKCIFKVMSLFIFSFTHILAFSISSALQNNFPQYPD